MNKSIQITKQKLVNIFVVIFFVVILFFSITFFSIKFLKTIALEKNEFINFISSIDNGLLSIDEMIDMGAKITLQKQSSNQTKFQASHKDLDFRPSFFMNYILVNDNDFIISSSIIDDVDEKFIFSIIQDQELSKFSKKGDYFVKKLQTKDNQKFIVFKKGRYNVSDYLSDIGWSFMLILFFSGFLYFIGLKFVDRVFIPVEDSMKDMKDFIHNAGHELKTPISVIDSNIQLIDDMKRYDAGMTKELKKEVLRLNSIIEGLIKLSTIDSLKDVINSNLQKSIEEIVQECKFKIAEKQIKVSINLPKDIDVIANKDYFYIFLSNIIANAIKYNNKKGTINISYNNGKLIIKDSGIGINKKDLEKIFNRFFKSDTSRNSDGFGIGLSLVKKIADLYKWNIVVKSEENNGSTFIIKF